MFWADRQIRPSQAKGPLAAALRETRFLTFRMAWSGNWVKKKTAHAGYASNGTNPLRDEAADQGGAPVFRKMPDPRVRHFPYYVSFYFTVKLTGEDLT